MAFKHQLGKFVLGAAGLFGMEKVTTETQKPSSIEQQMDDEEINTTSRKPLQEIDHAPSDNRENEQPESEAALATRQIESLPRAIDLPHLKGLQEQPRQVKPTTTPEKNLTSFDNLDRFKNLLDEISHQLKFPFLNHHTHETAKGLRDGTLDLAFKNTEPLEDGTTHVVIDTIFDETWLHLLELVLHPAHQEIEIIPNDHMQEMVPTVRVPLDPEEFKMVVRQYLEQI
jgi:hypothetical protein